MAAVSPMLDPETAPRMRRQNKDKQ